MPNPLSTNDITAGYRPSYISGAAATGDFWPQHCQASHVLNYSSLCMQLVAKIQRILRMQLHGSGGSNQNGVFLSSLEHASLQDECMLTAGDHA